MSFTYFIKTEVQGKSSLEQLAQAAGKADQAIDKLGPSSESAGKRAESAFGGMGNRLRSFIATASIAATTISSLNAAADTTSLDNAIKFAGGKDGVENLSFVNQTIESLQTPIQSAKQGFKILSGGMMESGIAAEDQRKIFYSVAEAARVMGLSSDDTTGALIALGQVASKGKVQAEELRGQLGERIPGAFAIAARAMGMTQKELDKTMSTGNLMAKDFLPKFAAEMHRTFGPGLTDALNSPRAQFDKFQNSLYALKTVLGQELMPTATNLINNVLVPFAKWIGENRKELGFLAIGLTGAYVATKVYAITAWVSTLATGGLTGAVAALNAVFLANPVGFVVGALVALGAIVVYAWNNFDGFRGAVMGVWNVVKPLVGLLWDGLVKGFQQLRWITGLMWDGLVIGGKQLYEFTKPVIELGKTVVDFLIKPFQTAVDILGGIFPSIGKLASSEGFGIGKKFTEGWNIGLGASKIDPLASLAPKVETPLFNSPFGTIPGGRTKADPNADKAKSIADGVTGGGSKNVTLNINSLISQLTLQSQNVQEGADQIGNIVIKTILQALNSANQAQTN